MAKGRTKRSIHSTFAKATSSSETLVQQRDVAYAEEPRVQSAQYSHMLVYTSVAGGPSIQFKKQGAPVHTISFDEKVGIINSGITKNTIVGIEGSL